MESTMVVSEPLDKASGLERISGNCKKILRGLQGGVPTKTSNALQNTVKTLGQLVNVLSRQDKEAKRGSVEARIPLDDAANKTIPKINSLEDLTENMPSICQAIFEQLGSQQTEATYQNCLKIDLEEAGVLVIIEPEIQLTYKGQVVGSRRSDLILTTSSGERAVVELKAVDTPTNDHLKQLSFYMEHLSIDRGYLVNFPHDAGFASVQDKSIFCVKPLCAAMPDAWKTMGPQLILRNAPGKRPVELVEVYRRPMSSSERRALVVASTSQQPVEHSPGVFGITKHGTPCTVCIKKGIYCHMHLKQRTRKYLNQLKY